MSNDGSAMHSPTTCDHSRSERCANRADMIKIYPGPRLDQAVFRALLDCTLLQKPSRQTAAHLPESGTVAVRVAVN
jgi:hypothetical protein